MQVTRGFTAATATRKWAVVTCEAIKGASGTVAGAPEQRRPAEPAEGTERSSSRCHVVWGSWGEFFGAREAKGEVPPPFGQMALKLRSEPSGAIRGHWEPFGAIRSY